MSFSGNSFSGKSFHLLPNPDEKIIANISGQQQSLNISGEVKEVVFNPQNQPGQIFITLNAVYNNSFNPSIATNQSIFQNYSIEYIMNILNQQNISQEYRVKLQSQINDFEQECNKENPDHYRLKSNLILLFP